MDEAIALEEKAAELGHTGPAFAAMAKKMKGCEKDLECFLGTLPGLEQAKKEQMIEIFTTPGTDEELASSLELAAGFIRGSPEMVNMFNAAACWFDHLTPVFFDTWQVSRETGTYWFWPNVWTDDEFAAFAEEAGLVEYWRAKGWPDVCGPQGDGFTCAESSGIN